MAMRFVGRRKRMRSRSRGVQSTALVAVSAKQAEMNLARKVIQLSKYVKGLQPEMKFLDVNQSTANVTPSTGVTLLMSAVATGAGVTNRVGENISVKYWEVNFEAVFVGSVAVATNDNPSYRFYVVQDRQQIANTAPVLSDLVDDPSIPTTQLLSITEQKRFRILYDSGPQVTNNNFVAGGTPSALGDVKLGVKSYFRSAFLAI